jgi:hypothetical protein
MGSILVVLFLYQRKVILRISAQIANKNSLQIREVGRPWLSSTSETALGKDDDKNGVWDDVDQYIASGFKDPEKAKAMRQLAIAIQNALINNDTPEKAQEATRLCLQWQN